jgi:hypothetical protein
MDFVEGGTGSDIETCVTCDIDGNEEVNIKTEETIDIKDEIPEAESFPPIKTELEVRLWGLCEVVAVDGCRLFVGPTSVCQITLNCFLFCGLRYVKS